MLLAPGPISDHDSSEAEDTQEVTKGAQKFDITNGSCIRHSVPRLSIPYVPWLTSRPTLGPGTQHNASFLTPVITRTLCASTVSDFADGVLACV